MTTAPGPCPCGSGELYAGCCGPILDGQRLAATAEQLMRSRYTAFALGDEGHLVRTWHPRTRPAQVDLDDTEWTGLTVVASHAGGAEDAEGTVEFVARWRRGGRSGRMHEVSRFSRRAGRWLYVDGDHD